MQMGIVKGSVQATVKHAVLEGEKILIVQPVGADLKPSGSSLLALDRVQAGAGDLVLVVDEGNSARIILENNEAPMRSVIFAIIDSVDLYDVP